jgi:hypothetical protein
LPKPTNNLPTQELPTNTLTQDETVTSGDAPVASAAVVEPIAFTEPGKVVPLKGRAKKREAADVAVTAPAGRAMTAHPKPEKRKNAKERAKEKYAKKNSAKDETKDGAKEETMDGTRPMTATAKSKVDKKAEAKAKKHKAA